MGPAVRGRRCRRIRNPLSPTPHRTFGSHSQRTRIPTDSRTRVIPDTSHRAAIFLKVPGLIYRIGREPDPWSVPDWASAGPDGTFGNRFDDPEGSTASCTHPLKDLVVFSKR